jgi:SAM-dependent methyltransferase
MTESRKQRDYLTFWQDVAANFPSLKHAESTHYYLACERTLCEQFFPALPGLLVLKSDLWDEAKNSEILHWIAEKGAETTGIDIAHEIVLQARSLLGKQRLAAADARLLPFKNDTFDLIYSMGTIEHFKEYQTAVVEFYRVLKPSGVAIVGVPNKLDPFLRPLLVSLLNKLGLYPYGMEQSFTPSKLRGLLESAGFQAIQLSGILFMPGWLRMLDLWCHVHRPQWAKVTGLLTRPFAWVYRNVPAVRRHGYLIAWAVTKPNCDTATRYVQT